MAPLHDAFRHYPLPWTVGDEAFGNTIKAANGRTLAYVQLAAGDGDVAQLLAASPQLLEATIGLVASASSTVSTEHLARQVAAGVAAIHAAGVA